MASKRIHVKGSRALVLGMTFKENCPDIRNSKVVDVIRELQEARRDGRHLRPVGRSGRVPATSTA